MMILLVLITSVTCLSSQYNFRISENRSPNTFVGQILVKTEFKYEFYEKGDMFIFDESNGIIRTKRSLDREIMPAISMYIYERDGTSFIRTITVSISIIDENDNAPSFSPSKITRTVVENAALLTEIGLPTASDNDSDEFGLRHNYRIEYGNEDGRFQLVTTDEGRGPILLRLVRPLDRESRARYELTVAVDDRGEPPLVGRLYVALLVQDYNDNGPVFSPSKYSVRVNESAQTGTVIVTVFASDADEGENSRVSYRFRRTSSTIEGEFSLDADSGTIVLTKGISCHRIQSVCLIIVEAYDHGTPSLAAVCYVSISIVRANLHPPRLKVSFMHSLTTAAFIEIGTVTRRPLAIIRAEDDDGSGEISVSLVSNRTDPLFTVRRSQGNVYILRQVSKTTPNDPRTFTLTLRAVDSGSPPRQSLTTIQVNVNNKNAFRPSFVQRDVQVTVCEDTPEHTFITRLQAVDRDSGPNGEVKYSILGSNADSLFSIGAQSGLLETRKSLWFLGAFKWNVTVFAKDSAINPLSSSAFVIITVTRSQRLQARFLRRGPTVLVLDQGIRGSRVSHNFTDNIQVSDAKRANEVVFTALHSRFTFVGNLLFLTNICPVQQTVNVTIIMSHSTVQLDKMQLTLSISPRAIYQACWAHELVYVTELPRFFSYNAVLLDLATTIPFQGSFSSMSELEIFFVSPAGRVFWRGEVRQGTYNATLNILYKFTYKGLSLTRIVRVIVQRALWTDALLDCPSLQAAASSSRDNIDLLSFQSTIELKVGTSFALIENWESSGTQILDSHRLFIPEKCSSTSSTILVTHSLHGYQRCTVTFGERTSFRFSRESFFFRTEECEEGASIGKIESEGLFEPSVVGLLLSGEYSSLFTYSVSKKSLLLTESISRENRVRFVSLSLTLVDQRSNLSVITVPVYVEFQSLFASAEFRKPSYTFAVPENVATHTPLGRVDLVPPQSFLDFEFHSDSQWMLFPDGSLYVLDALDHEVSREHHFVVTAVNKVDKKRRVSVPITVLVGDVNDNSPIFIEETYFFHVSVDGCGTNAIGYVRAVDDDEGLNGAFEYTLVGTGATTSLLQIDPISGLLSIDGCMKTLTGRRHVRVRASDFGDPSRNSTVDVFVTVLLHPPVRIRFLSRTFVDVPENSTIGSIIWKVEANGCDNIRYRLLLGDGKAPFRVNDTTGEITVLRALDREKQSQHAVPVQASCLAPSKSASTTLWLSVTDVNDNRPLFVDECQTNITVSEIVSVGTILARYRATDADIGVNGAVTYRLSTAGQEESTTFKIDAFSGLLYLNRDLDHEHRTRWDLTITAVDGGAPSLNAVVTVTIHVTNVNDHKPSFSDDSPTHLSVSVDAPHGTVIGHLQAQDADKNGILFAFASVTPQTHPFAISRATGDISYVRTTVSRGFYEATVVAMDAERDQWYVTQRVTVSVLGRVNEETDIFTYGAVVLPATLFFGEKIATIVARSRDPDNDGKLVYRITNSTINNIVINSFTGDLFIQSRSPLDFTVIELTVTVSQEPSLSSKKVTLLSTKLIRNRGNFHNLNFQKTEYIIDIAEDEALADRKLLRLHALYPGNPIANLEYLITDMFMGIASRRRLPHSTIILDPSTGWLRIGHAHIDREVIEGGQITVHVLVLDLGKDIPQICTTKIFINILDRNDNIPLFSNETFVFHVPENVSTSSRLFVGRLRAMDKDLESSLVYDWVNGQNTYFNLDRLTGVVTTTGIPLDYEKMKLVLLNARVSDGLFSSTSAVMVIVDDINDQGPVFTKDTYELQCRENVPINTILGQVRAVDGDSAENARVRYTLIGDWGGGVFGVHPEYGIISSIAEIDYEKGSHYLLLVTATDTSPQSLISLARETVTATVVVLIINENDNRPVFLAGKTEISVSEDAVVGAPLVRLEASDRDTEDVLLYRIVSSHDGIFEIDPFNGTVTLAGNLDFEECSSHTIKIVCTDGTWSTSTLVHVSVVNVNDERPVVHNPPVTFISGLEDRQSYFLYCTDEDKLDALRYDFRVHPSSAYNVAINVSTGEIRFARGSNRSIAGEIRCSDGGHVSRKNVTIHFSSNSAQRSSMSVSVAKYPTDNAVLGPHWMRARYPTVAPNYSFYLQPSGEKTHQDDWIFFRIDPFTGELSKTTFLDSPNRVYLVTVVARPGIFTAVPLLVDMSISYTSTAPCRPAFVRTPYIYKILYPVIERRKIGTSSVKFCPGNVVEYYLSSGQSFFSVNVSSGAIFISSSPPQGHYQYKLTAVVYGPSKTFISTTFTVITVNTDKGNARCQLDTLRLFVNVTDPPGTVIGRVVIKYLPTKVEEIAFSLPNSYLFSIGNEGAIFVAGNLSATSERSFNSTAIVTWSTFLKEHSVKCRIIIDIVRKVNDCTLYLQYPGYSVELSVPNDLAPDSFIFSLPVAHSDCELKPYETRYKVTDLNFNIDPRYGNITSRKPLLLGPHLFIVLVSSSNARRPLEVPVTVNVVPRMTHTEISFNVNIFRYTVPRDIARGSLLGRVEATVTPASHNASLRYSIVSFCCVYPTNIAVYNGSIRQSLIRVIDISGNLFVQDVLSTSARSYDVVVRAYIESTSPQAYQFKDAHVVIDVIAPPCACTHAVFQVSVIEGSVEGVTVLENALVLNRKESLVITLHPESTGKYFKYHLATNTVSTTANRLDFEQFNELELELTVAHAGTEILRCPGVVHVVDINDNAPRFLRNYFIGFIGENSPPNSWIIDVEVTDEDSHSFPLTFSLSGEGNECFVIDSRNGSVFSAKVLDREQRGQYNMKIRVSDGIHALETGMLINVVDANDHAPQISTNDMNTTVVINRSNIMKGNFSVRTITSTDADDPISNNSRTFCELVPSSVLTRKIISLNSSTCEVTVDPKYAYLISPNLTLALPITVHDKGRPSLSNSTFLRIHFVDESGEMRISKKSRQHPIAVLYTSPSGTPLLSLSLSNKNAFTKVLFETVSGNGSSYFTVDSANGLIATKQTVLNLKIGSFYSLDLQACGINRNTTFLQCSDVVRVDFIICDFNLHSPEIIVHPTTVSIPEDFEIRKRIVNVQIADKDEGLPGLMTVGMDESSARTFSLLKTRERNTFDLVTTASLDYEQARLHSITLTVHDLGSPARSQTVTVTVMVTDIDDNVPYFLNTHIIVHLPTPQSPLNLDLAQDVDVGDKNRYTASPSGSVVFRYFKDRLEAYVQKPYWNMSSLQITVSVSGSKRGMLKVFLTMGSVTWDVLECPVLEDQSAASTTDLQYHLLTVRPRSVKHLVRVNERSGQLTDISGEVAKDIVLSVSRARHLHIQYKICRVKTPGKDAGTATYYRLIVPRITIEKSVEKGTEVGRIEVLNNGENVSRKFYFSLRGDFFFPFNCLNKRNVIVSSRKVDANSHSWYNVTVTASHRNTSLVGENLEGNVFIEVDSVERSVALVSLSMRVREMEGHGVVIGRMKEMVPHDLEGDNYVLESDRKSAITMDKMGILRVSGDLDREQQDRLVLHLSSRYSRVTMTVLVEDENDSPSETRKTNVVLNVERSIRNLGMVTLLVPLDKDMRGDFGCRLESLSVPRGVLLTPDCRLYVLDSWDLFNQTSVFTVLHHDGVHPAVTSVFYLDVRGKNFAANDNDWLLLVLPTFELVHVLPRLRLLKEFLLSEKMVHFLVGLNPAERHIVLRVNGTTAHDLRRLLSVHKSHIEQILNEKTIEMVTDICNVDSCDFHGSCSSVLRVDYEEMFTDDDQRQRGEMHIYPLMVVTNVCSCQKGYLGSSCNMSATCPYQICHNGGTCGKDVSGHTICECSTGFSGDHCDQDVNECNYGQWCGTNGKCINVHGGHKCECNLEWSGSPACNRPFNHCQSSQCSSPGTSHCVPVIGGFQCHCLFGYYGDKCTLSAFSLAPQSLLQWELSTINTLSVQFVTISQNAPLLKLFLFSSLHIQVVIAMAKIRLSLANQNQVLHYRQTSMEVAYGNWMKMDLAVTEDKLSLRIMECGSLGDCETTNAVYGGTTRTQETLTIRTSFTMPLNQVTVSLGNEESPRLVGQRFFVGCMRNVEIYNVSVITRKESNVLYDSCPRFRNEVAPCGNAAEKCGAVGDCIDEWFVGRCTCPEGYQPPSCSPGFPAFSLSPNTVISFLRRPDYPALQNRRQKRQVLELMTEISLRIKTSDVNSIILLSLSSLHTFTLIQISNGMIKIIDKFAGSSQEMVHKAVLVNDNKVHSVVVTRSSVGRHSVTVDSVTAVIEWLQSHDPLGPSVQTIYLAGVPLSDRSDELLDLPNYSGCLSEVRFNNVTQPLQGLTERFNVSLVQGQVATGCSSDVCLRPKVCGEYQECQEVAGTVSSYWGQYQCVNNERRRLVAILTPVIVCLAVFVALLILLICLRSRLRRKKLSKKHSKAISVPDENRQTLPTSSKRMPPRSATSSTLLMQDVSHDPCRPDLIRSHGIRSLGYKQSIPMFHDQYQDTSLVNAYISTSQLESRIASAKIHPRMGFHKHGNIRSLSISNSALQGTDDSTVYKCSHPDEYEAVSSRRSSNSQENVKWPLSHHSLVQTNPQNFTDRSLSRNDAAINSGKAGLSSSSSNASHRMTRGPRRDRHGPLPEVFSNNESTFTDSVLVEPSNDSLSSHDSAHHAFTPTNSSDSAASNTDVSVPRSSNCWRNIQRALPPPPPLQSDAQYELVDDHRVHRV